MMAPELLNRDRKYGKDKGGFIFLPREFASPGMRCGMD